VGDLETTFRGDASIFFFLNCPSNPREAHGTRDTQKPETKGTATN